MFREKRKKAIGLELNLKTFKKCDVGYSTKRLELDRDTDAERANLIYLRGKSEQIGVGTTGGIVARSWTKSVELLVNVVVFEVSAMVQILGVTVQWFFDFVGSTLGAGRNGPFAAGCSTLGLWLLGRSIGAGRCGSARFKRGWTTDRTLVGRDCFLARATDPKSLSTAPASVASSPRLTSF